ncbi:MAG: cache domain-containing protein [Marinilabiliaceae bacterium]
MRAMAEEHLDEVSALTASEVSASLKSLRDELTWIARHPSVESMDWDSMSEYLSEVTERSSERLTNIMVVERDGSYFFAGKGRVEGWTVADRKYYLDIMEGRAFSITDPDVSRVTGKMKYTLSVPISGANGTTVGCLASNISLDILSGMLTDSKGTETGFRWVVDSRGYVIGSADKELLLSYNLKEASGKCEGMGPLMDAIGRRESGRGYMTLENGQRYFATCQPIGGTPGWALLSAVADTRLTGLATGMIRRTLTAMGLVMIITVMAVMRVTRKEEREKRTEE